LSDPVLSQYPAKAPRRSPWGLPVLVERWRLRMRVAGDWRLQLAWNWHPRPGPLELDPHPCPDRVQAAPAGIRTAHHKQITGIPRTPRDSSCKPARFG